MQIMATMFLTDPFLRSLRPGSNRDEEHRDRNVKGLVIRVTSAGTKTWSVQYRFNGRNRRLTLGPYPLFGLADARQRAREALYQVATGKDPGAHKQELLHAETFADLAKQYIERHARFKRTGREDYRML
jgi:Arm DNA-binding domain